jgi:hypothetical protein
VLAGLTFGKQEVVGVEINDQILDALKNRFGDFTGHIDRDPAVRLVNDEARSYVARTDERFDLIQISLIDTWAATAAGAFTFTENALYTVEAWRTFLLRLTPTGVLSVSRWYYGEIPAETYRLVSLAAEALRQQGVANPRQHMLLAALHVPRGGNGVGTILVSPSAISDADVARFEQVNRDMAFSVLLTPRSAADPMLATLASPQVGAPSMADAPFDLSPPTDDRPFFFHMLRWRSILNSDLWATGATSFNVQAIFILGTLLAVTVGLTALCIIGPLMLTTQRETLRGASPFFVFFAAIGVGFMLIEISQMQRLSVFLGHPTYGLSVALFSLLLSSGLGSLTTGLRSDALSPRVRLLCLLGALVAFGLLTPLVVHRLAAAMTPLRIAAAVAMLAPLGFCMGMAFPLGMELAARRTPALAPWLWGINGATSVCASVIALVIALTWGISASFWTGFACYCVAYAAYAGAALRQQNS